MSNELFYIVRFEKEFPLNTYKYCNIVPLSDLNRGVTKRYYKGVWRFGRNRGSLTGTRDDVTGDFCYLTKYYTSKKTANAVLSRLRKRDRERTKIEYFYFVLKKFRSISDFLKSLSN